MIESVKHTWPCPGKPEDLKGQPIGMYHCEFCGEMQIAGLPHLPPQFPSQWEEPFPKVAEPEGPEAPRLRVVMKDGRIFEGKLFDKSYDAYKHDGWFDLVDLVTEHPEVPEVFLFEECASVVDVDSPDVNLLVTWTKGADMVTYPTSQVRMESVELIDAPHTRPPLESSIELPYAVDVPGVLGAVQRHVCARGRALSLRSSAAHGGACRHRGQGTVRCMHLRVHRLPRRGST